MARKLILAEGYSLAPPVVNIEEIENGHRVTITDKNGVQSFDVLNGNPADVEKLVEDYLAQNPPEANITVDGEDAQPVLSVCATVGSKLAELVIKDGQLIFVKDKHRIALDFDGKRTFYNQIEELDTDLDRASMTDPVEGLYYFVIETAVLWTYRDGWVQITTSPKEVVFFGTELPELGVPKTLYVNTDAREISVWNEETNAYMAVSNYVEDVTISDIESLFE